MSKKIKGEYTLQSTKANALLPEKEPTLSWQEVVVLSFMLIVFLSVCALAFMANPFMFSVVFLAVMLMGAL